MERTTLQAEMLAAAAQGISAGAGVVLQDEHADVAMTDAEAGAVATGEGVVAERLAASEPPHGGGGRGPAQAADADHYFALRVHLGSHAREEVLRTFWEGDKHTQGMKLCGKSHFTKNGK